MASKCFCLNVGNGHQESCGTTKGTLPQVWGAGIVFRLLVVCFAVLPETIYH